MSEISIKVAGISKRYDLYDRPFQRLIDLFRNSSQHGRPFWALKNVSFECHAGDSVGIIGRNGSGKSTLLQLLSGTLRPTEGEVVVSGRVAALLELGSGFNPEFTGLENVYLNASILGLTKKQVDDRLRSILDFAEIGDFIHQPVKNYSSGMFLRLAFAVVAHVDADILIVDEALAVGDVLFVQKCMRFIRKFREKGILLFVSHDPALVTGLCDKAIWLNQGKVQSQGKSEAVTKDYLDFLMQEEHRNSVSATEDQAPLPLSMMKLLQAEAREDFREEFLKKTKNRNLIYSDPSDSPMVFDCAVQTGLVTVTEVYFVSHQGSKTNQIFGGEELSLVVEWVAHAEIQRPIVGFMVKDRMGQFLFGDNTYITTLVTPVHAELEQKMAAIFEFQMPYLPRGDYSVMVSVAEGTQDNHTQHQWIHDALIFRSMSSHVAGGLIGVPMRRIELFGLMDGSDANQ